MITGKLLLNALVGQKTRCHCGTLARDYSSLTVLSGGRTYPGCSGTLSDNYITYRIVLKLVITGLKREHMFSKVEAKFYLELHELVENLETQRSTKIAVL